MQPTAYSPPTQPRAPESTEPLPKQELREALAAACAGDSLAFARLYDFYSARVYTYVYFNVGDEQTADDLSARIFLKAWRSIGCFDPTRQPFGAWLYLVARAVLVDVADTHGDASTVKDILSPADDGDPCSHR